MSEETEIDPKPHIEIGQVINCVTSYGVLTTQVKEMKVSCIGVREDPDTRNQTYLHMQVNQLVLTLQDSFLSWEIVAPDQVR